MPKSRTHSAKAWTEVRVVVPDGWGELVASLFAASPFTGVAFGPSSFASDPAPAGSDYLRAFVPVDHDTPELRAQVRADLDDLAARVELPELHDLSVRFQALPAEDWANSWKKTWRAFRCGDLAVVPCHFDGALRPTDRRLELDPGGVFGTGRHATTRTCIKVLQERLRGGESVLDAGCGTGILAATALRFGAAHVLGFDVDAGAPSHFAELMADNGLEDQATIRLGGFEVLEPHETFDVVLANIYSDIISEHARDLAARLTPAAEGGWFAFSGCPVHHVRETRACIEQAGLTIEEERIRGLWHTFVGHRTA
jgi:ribosomal protein L11 methyltransferase